MEAQLKKRRSVFVFLLMIILLVIGVGPDFLSDDSQINEQVAVLSQDIEGTELVNGVLDSLTVKGRAPKTGYTRSEFGNGWAQIGNCDVRNIMLARGMTDDIKFAEDGCVVLSGALQDKYTGDTIFFVRGSTTSSKVQIDHVVALSDSWQKGAQVISYELRTRLANDPLNLLAVDGPANQQKGGSDAASWLPSNKGYRCLYVARQVAVKSKYNLWVTEAERAAMKRVINGCGDQVIPIEE